MVGDNLKGDIILIYITKRRVFISQSFAIFGLLGLSLISCNPKVAKTMKLTSNAFVDNGLIPVEYTCDGADMSPPLSWEEIPPNTQSLTLIVDDPDAPGMTFVHWVVYDLPPTVKQLQEKIPSSKTIANGGIQGKNDFGKLGYGGPCPPSGTHRYFFHLYALDKKLNLEPGVSKNQILTAMAGHVLAKAELMGKYQRLG